MPTYKLTHPDHSKLSISVDVSDELKNTLNETAFNAHIRSRLAHALQRSRAHFDTKNRRLPTNGWVRVT